MRRVAPKAVRLYWRVVALTQPSGSDVGGDEDTVGGVAELRQYVVAVLLVLVAVDGQRAPSRAVYGFVNFIHLPKSFDVQ